MLSFLPSTVLGLIGIILVFINTVFHVSILVPIAVVKILIPLNFFRNLFGRINNAIATNWILCNNFTMYLITKIKWDVEFIGTYNSNGRYLVISNHQSNLDIVILQKIFYNKIPFLKFFIKSELRWVPLLGLAWWALDFPFMKRYSKEFLEKHPHLKGKDIEKTKKFCEKYKHGSISIVNFLEGTRFSKVKSKNQKSPFKNLLKPKAGGMGYVLSVMGNQLNNIIDVTIVYPYEKKSLWEFFCNKVSEVIVKVRVFPINAELLGDYIMDDNYRENFQLWVNNLWEKKDEMISNMISRNK